MSVTKSRRDFLRLGVLTAAGMALSACTPKEVVKEVTKVVEVEVPVKETVVVIKGQMRDLEGTITVATEGVVPVPGMPLTKKQEAWAKVLDIYKELQPKVELVLQDLPEGLIGETWCESVKNSATMPDITYVGECNYFGPSQEEVDADESLCRDWIEFEDEINPYTGRPWKEDWVNDAVRLGRCQGGGALGHWTCQTVQFGGHALWVNEDILAEYGYEDGAWPETLTELWDLSDKINADGKYTAWDSHGRAWEGRLRSLTTGLAMDVWERAGGDLDNPGEKENQWIRRRGNLQLQMCNHNYWFSETPSLKEAVRQLKKMTDAWGGEAYFDPTRDQTGRLWVTGKAALSLAGTGFNANIEQAKADGVWTDFNWRMERWPKMVKEDLVDKDVKIYWGGEQWMTAYGSGDVWAPKPRLRESGEDPNVDLITRDFFQFMSSPLGQQRMVDMGRIPVNPIALKQIKPELQKAMELKPEIFGNSLQPYVDTGNSLSHRDSEHHLLAYLRGDEPLEEALAKGDLNATKQMIKSYEEWRERTGLGEELPPVCDKYK